MKLLFAHDHRFARGDNGAIFTQGSFPREIWPRYLSNFSTLTVFARDEGMYAGGDLARSDAGDVQFQLVPSPSVAERLGLIKGKTMRSLEDSISAADAVIARLPSDIGLLAAHAASAAGKPLLLEVVGCALDGYGNHGAFASRLYAPFAMRRMRRAIAKASFVNYVTERWLQGRYPASDTAFATQVSDVSITRAGESTLAGREARLDAIRGGKRPVFGTLASLRTASKGLQTMITALAQLRKAGQKIEWRVLGPGDPARWREMAQLHGVADQIHFDGVRPAGEAVLEWLDSIDVHCQPSFQEGLPRATIEAMSRGCACLGSTAGGIPELLPLDRLHAPGDTAALANLIGKMGNDPDRIAEASQRDRAASVRYEAASIDNVRAKVFARFADAAAGGRRGG